MVKGENQLKNSPMVNGHVNWSTVNCLRFALTCDLRLATFSDGIRVPFNPGQKTGLKYLVLTYVHMQFSSSIVEDPRYPISCLLSDDLKSEHHHTIIMPVLSNVTNIEMEKLNGEQAVYIQRFKSQAAMAFDNAYR